MFPFPVIKQKQCISTSLPNKKVDFFFNEQLSVKSKFEVPYRWKPGADNNINIWL